MGDLGRTQPLSRYFGFDRGTPIDRYYIERFLQKHAADIRGRVLEVGDRQYTVRFGQDRVTKSDVFHASQGNPEATIIGNLAESNALPESAFDCIILVQTLPYIFNVRQAISTCFHALKPGGVVLASSSGINKISRPDMEKWGEYWHFTSLSMRLLFAEFFGEDVQTDAPGNVLAAVAFLHGLAAEEVGQDTLDVSDLDYEVVVSVRAAKAALEPSVRSR